jgi:flavin-dependent dehydrogenase
MYTRLFSRLASDRKSSIRLENNSRVAVIGGGPAGSFFSYFLMDMAARVGIDVEIDIYEPRDFSLPAPHGCNMCAGVISETLVQNLATEGINLPSTVVQKAIGSYVLHTDLGSQRIDAASHEKRIGVIFRGAGPHGIREIQFQGFDGQLLSLAKDKGVKHIRSRVTGVERIGDQLQIRTHDKSIEKYDLLAVAAGVNTAAIKLFLELAPQYKPPKTSKTAIREYFLGKEIVQEHLGDSLHVFLLNIPRLDFAMIIPKGDYVSVCLLGTDIDDDLIRAFLTSSEVRSCFPEDFNWDQPNCQCLPRINVGAAIRPYADRMVFIGDSGASRLFKDGIGSAYRSAKAAATCAVLEGISAEDFQRYYAPFYKKMELDNHFGRLIFSVTHIIKRVRFLREAVLRMVADEQSSAVSQLRMSSILWDIFTGSAPYQDIILHALHPAFSSRFIWQLAGLGLGG